MAKRPTKQKPKPLQQPDLLALLGGPEVGSDVLLAIDMRGKAGLRQLLRIASGEVAKASAEQRGRAIFALSVFAWKPAAETIAGLALDDEPGVRQQAILALPRFDEKFARQSLLKLLSKPEFSEIELAQTLDGLGLIGDARTAKAIQKWSVNAPSATIRQIARNAVAQIQLPNLSTETQD